MRTNIVLTMTILFVITLFGGCGYDEVTSLDGGLTYNFSVGDVKFHIETGYGQSSNAYNGTSYRYWISVVECEHGDCDGPAVSFTLDERHQTKSWRANYEVGDHINIVMRSNGTETNNEIKLGKITANVLGVELNIKAKKMKIGIYDSDIDPGIETDDINEANYIEYEIEVSLI